MNENLLPGVAIFVGKHGRGSNMAVLAEACRAEYVPAEVTVVISPSGESRAAQRAEELGLRVAVLDTSDEEAAESVVALLGKARVRWICLAGYMRLLPKAILEAFPNRILNIHPALLPKFGGKGMYGIRVHQAVLAAREKISGCTVHLVNERYDEGRIVLQMKCPVLEGDTAESLAERVLALEHKAYPEALRQMIERDIAVARAATTS